jgi:hypothetical protein
MLGRGLAHWSFLFNSEASLLEGNRIQDNGPGASPRFATVATVEGYSPLDQYLMGFRAASEVPPTFLVTDSPSISTGAMAPRKGVRFDGNRRDISIDDIISAVGRRTPDATVSQRAFRFAFILIVPAGQPPDPNQLAQLESYRSAFEAAYAQYTSGLASADTTLKRALHLSVFPAAGVLAGSTMTASIVLDKPIADPLTIQLQSTGLVDVPASLIIPAGVSRVAFPITGIHVGVDTLTAAAGPQYETAVAHIQVSCQAAHN